MNPKKTIYFIMLLVWIVILFWFRPWDNLKEYMIGKQAQADSSTMVYGALSVEQTFMANGIFDSVDINIDNYDHTYEGSFTVNIYDESGRCIYGREIDKTELGTGWLELHLDETVSSEFNQYQIEVSAPKLKEDNCVMIFHSDTQTYDNGEMYLSGKRQDKTICFSVYRLRKNIFAYLALLIFLASVFGWWFNRKKSIMRISVIVLAGMGLCMLVMMAPMSQPDEDYHYNSALALSNVIMGQDNIYECPYEYYNLDGLVVHQNANSAYVRVIQDFFEEKEKISDPTYLYDQRTDQLYHPIIYLAPALGITLGRYLGLGFIFTHYLGRLFNLLIYICMALTAIKVIPQKKEWMLLVSSLPMCLHQASSYSYDVVVNGMSFLLVAYILKLAYQDEWVTWKNVFVLMAISGVLCPDKLVYSVLLLLVFIIPKEKYMSLKDYRQKVAAVLLFAAVSVFAAQYHIVQNMLGSGQVSAGSRYYSAQFIFENPIKYIKLLYNTIDLYIAGWFTRGNIGSSLAGLTLPVSEYLICGFVVLIFLSFYKKDEDICILNRRQKMICSGTVLIGIVLIISALARVNLYGVHAFAAIQGRYFIPLMLPALLCIHTQKIIVDVDGRKLFFVYWFLQAGIMNTILSSVVL